MDDLTCVTPADVERAHETLVSDRANVIAKNAVTSQGVRAAARVVEAVARDTTVFDVEVKQGKRTDQERSGRCWMFAALNTMRCRVIERYGLENFELSQAYPLFWDKVEKGNWFLENIIDTADEPLDGRLVSFLLESPVEDGGQWDMLKDLVKKYGVMPREAMPETACSKDTREMDAYLTRYLRGAAKRLRDAHAGGAPDGELRRLKKDMMSDVYRICETCLGQPPASFDVRLRDKDGKLVLSGTYTPRGFLEDVVQMDVDDYVSVISAPTPDKPFDHVYTVDRLGNVVEEGGVRYLNLPVSELKRLAIAQLKDGHPVWFGSDAIQSFLKDDGVMDTGALDIDGLFGFPVEGALDRADRLAYGESCMCHAMVLEGVNLDAERKPTLWKAENSWGDKHGRDGFDALSDAWFDAYVYQVVVDRKYLTDDERRIFDEETPTVLAPWDPMGSLALCR